MQIAKVTDGAIVEVAHYRTFYTNIRWRVSPPDDTQLARDGYMRVSMQVTYDPDTQKLQKCDPYLDGEYVRTVQAVAKTADDTAAENAKIASRNREKRDRLLAESDWTQFNDSPLGSSSKTAWATYRQELRDITSHANWPNLTPQGQDGTGGDWPTKPN